MDGRISREKYLALKLENQGQVVLPQVVELLRNSKVVDSCYAFKLRIKSEDKLLEKVTRKQNDRPEYSLTSITDVVGLRLVALFRSDMIDILDGCLQAIAHHNGVSPNPFCKGMPEEIIIYKGNSAVDDLIPHIRETITRVCGDHMVVSEETSKEGYSSIHLVARLTCHGLSETFPADYRIPIEIQIRTVFEDAWGEIDHKFGYAIRSGKHKGSPIQNPDTVLAHLKVLKGFTDACMVYGEAIRQDATRKIAVIPVKTVVYPVDSGSELIERFNALSVPKEFVDRFIEASRLKDESLRDSEAQPHQKRAKHSEAAQAFRELARDVESTASTSAGVDLMIYYARLNEALCTMAIDDRGSIQEAMSVLKSMEAKYSNHPMLLMRIGQAFGKLGLYKEAILRLGEAKRMLQQIEATIGPVSEGIHWPDNMPKTDYDYIVRTQPKLAGYYMWQQVLQQTDPSSKAALYASAYEVTLSGLATVADSSEILDSYHNNLLYYAVGYKSWSEVIGEYSSWTEVDADKAIESHLNFLEPGLVNVATISVGTLDTLMNAYAMLKNTSKAALVANAVKSRLLKDNNEHLDDSLALRYFKTAERILAGEPWSLQD